MSAPLTKLLVRFPRIEEKMQSNGPVSNDALQFMTMEDLFHACVWTHACVHVWACVCVHAQAYWGEILLLNASLSRAAFSLLKQVLSLNTELTIWLA